MLVGCCLTFVVFTCVTAYLLLVCLIACLVLYCISLCLLVCWWVVDYCFSLLLFWYFVFVFVCTFGLIGYVGCCWVCYFWADGCVV